VGTRKTKRVARSKKGGSNELGLTKKRAYQEKRGKRAKGEKKEENERDNKEKSSGHKRQLKKLSEPVTEGGCSYRF